MADDMDSPFANLPIAIRGLSRDRHGRGMRSAVTGPRLPQIRSRVEFFMLTVAHTVDYLRSILPDEMAGVQFDVAPLPTEGALAQGIERWSIDKANKRVVLFRIPIQRMGRLHRNDKMHRQMAIEAAVFQSVAELLGREPWDFGPDRYPL